MFFNDFDEKRARLLNPLVLAYIGDAVLSLYIREKLVSSFDMKSGGLHKAAIKYVSAEGQAKQFDAVADSLTGDESDIARRARNAHNTTRAKNSDLATYKKATSFEPVIGYLHLSGQTDRMAEIIEKALPAINEEQKRL